MAEAMTSTAERPSYTRFLHRYLNLGAPASALLTSIAVGALQAPCLQHFTLYPSLDSCHSFPAALTSYNQPSSNT